MRILCDIDGVAADFTKAVLEIVAEHTGKVRRHSDVTRWDIYGCLGLSDEERELVEHEMRCPGVAESLELLPGAREAVEELRELGDVYAVTSPLAGSLTWAGERTEWLKDQLGFDNKHIVHTASKGVVRGDVLIDDHAANVAEWLREHPNGLGILFDQPHNQGVSAGVRAYGWSDVLRLVRQHKEKLQRG